MVDRVPPTFNFAPLDHGKLGDPSESEHVGIGKPLAAGHLDPDGAQRLRRDRHGFRHQQEQVALHAL
jgi:hypothetical protein